MSQADAGAAIVASLATSTNYLLGVAASAQDAVKQAIVANFMIDAQYLLPAQLGDAASAQTNLAMAQSLRSTSDSYKLMARIAESTMPKVRNAIETGPVRDLSGLPALRGDQRSPGRGGHQVLRREPVLDSALGTALRGDELHHHDVFAQPVHQWQRRRRLAIEQMSFLNTAIISDQAIAGMLVISIPAIAAAIVQGRRGRPAGRRRSGGAAARPREDRQRPGHGQHADGPRLAQQCQSRHPKGLAVDMNPSLRQGMTNYQARGGFDYSHFSGGGFVVRRRKAMCAPTWRSTIPWARGEGELRAFAAGHPQHSAEYAESALGRAQAGSRIRAQPQPGQQRQHRLPPRHGLESQPRGQRQPAPGRSVGQKTRRQRKGGDGNDDRRLDGHEHAEAPRDRRASWGVEMSAKLRNSADAARSLEEMAQFASESGFGKKVGTVLDNGWERNYRSTDEGTAGSEGMRASLDRARQSREAFSASLQESEAHRQMWEQSRSGQLGASVQLQDHFIQDFLLPKLDFNYERLQGILGDPYRLRPYLDEYTAGTTTGCSASWRVGSRGASGPGAACGRSQPGPRGGRGRERCGRVSGRGAGQGGACRCPGAGTPE
jgi:conjugal transfer mating pair stabilization protein TraG